MEEKAPLKKLLFIYDMDPEKEKNWRDGLWAALKLLEKDYEIWWENLQTQHSMIVEGDWDFILGWGGFNSSVDRELGKDFYKHNKKGLCLGGYGFLPMGVDKYDIIFYETEWSKKWIRENSDSPDLPKLRHAFGINKDIFTKTNFSNKYIWDYMTVGAFSKWKRQEKLLEKKGFKLAVGEIQKGNLNESMDIVHHLLFHGVTVSGETSPEALLKLYNESEFIYIPAEVLGGGERSILEARACGASVQVELDNPKLQELLECPVWDHHYYAEQLKKGIESCLS